MIISIITKVATNTQTFTFTLLPVNTQTVLIIKGMQRLQKDIANDRVNIQYTYSILTTRKYKIKKLILELIGKIMSITNNMRRIRRFLLLFTLTCSAFLNTPFTFPYLLSLINRVEIHTGTIIVATMNPIGKDINVTNLYIFPVI